MIVKNKLLNFDKMVIYQDNEWFNFSLDSVLLANFVTLNKKDKRIIDLATGNAPIPMLLSKRTNNKIIGIELQKCIYDLAVSSINENNLSNQVSIINDDIKNIFSYYDYNSFDVVTCNPPYFILNKDSIINKSSVKSIARHEICINIEDIIKISSLLLNNGGRFAMVHISSRFSEILGLMKKYKLEPKKVQFVHSYFDRASSIFLIECVKKGKTGLKILPPLFTHNSDGSYSDNVKFMFGDDDCVAK